MQDLVKKQLVYWCQVTAAGAFTIQGGPGLLTIGLAASVYTITMPANFTVPLNRRFVVVTPTGATDLWANYAEAASAATTIVINGRTANTGVAVDAPFHLLVYRIEHVIGAGAG